MIRKTVRYDANNTHEPNKRDGLPPEIPSDSDEVRRLETALCRLHYLDREIFLAVSIDHMPAAEIARRTGLTTNQIERRIARALVAFDRAVCALPTPWWQQLRRQRWWPF